MTQQLTVQDLAAVVSVIDVAASRGAFKGEEMLPVGQLREKVAQTVAAAQKAAESQATDQSESPDS